MIIFQISRRKWKKVDMLKKNNTFFQNVKSKIQLIHIVPNTDRQLLYVLEFFYYLSLKSVVFFWHVINFFRKKCFFPISSIKSPLDAFFKFICIDSSEKYHEYTKYYTLLYIWAHINCQEIIEMCFFMYFFKFQPFLSWV